MTVLYRTFYAFGCNPQGWGECQKMSETFLLFCLITQGIATAGTIVLRHFFLVSYGASIIKPTY